MIPFSNTTEYKGLVQFYESEIGANYGDVSGNSVKLKEFTARVNLAIDRYFATAVQASGLWELDDFNHTADYATIYTNIVSGQRDYSFITDEQGNYILDIYKVLILPTATDTQYRELYPADENQSENLDIIDESNTAGVPTKYAKKGNAIFLGGAIPNYNATRGLKVLVNRTASRFTSSDTTKVAGFPYHQEYFYLKPALEYARRNSLATLPRLEAEILKLEGNVLTGQVGLIAKAYGNRRKDEIQSISGEVINSI
jgi:hypothetical protein